MKDSYIVGVDIGGSHITSALVDIRTKQIVEESYTRKAVDSSQEADQIIAAWSEAIGKPMRFRGHTEKIGIAMPGPFDYENGISLMRGQDKYEKLYQCNVKELLARRLDVDQRNIHMMNDAGCFLQGEVFGGAAQGAASAIGITLGTGLGTARYENGMATDADLWRLPFNDSIAEDYLSTRWFVKQYGERSGDTIANVKELVTLPKTEPYRAGIFETFAENLARFLKQFIENSSDPEVIVIGGNIALSARLFMPLLENILGSMHIGQSIKLATLGESAPIFGSAGYWLEAMNRNGEMS